MVTLHSTQCLPRQIGHFYYTTRCFRIQSEQAPEKTAAAFFLSSVEWRIKGANKSSYYAHQSGRSPMEDYSNKCLPST